MKWPDGFVAMYNENKTCFSTLISLDLSNLRRRPSRTYPSIRRYTGIPRDFRREKCAPAGRTSLTLPRIGRWDSQFGSRMGKHYPSIEDILLGRLQLPSYDTFPVPLKSRAAERRPGSLARVPAYREIPPPSPFSSFIIHKTKHPLHIHSDYT